MIILFLAGCLAVIFLTGVALGITLTTLGRPARGGDLPEETFRGIL